MLNKISGALEPKAIKVRFETSATVKKKKRWVFKAFPGVRGGKKDWNDCGKNVFEGFSSVNVWVLPGFDGNFDP